MSQRFWCGWRVGGLPDSSALVNIYGGVWNPDESGSLVIFESFEEAWLALRKQWRYELDFYKGAPPLSPLFAVGSIDFDSGFKIMSIDDIVGGDPVDNPRRLASLRATYLETKQWL